MNKKCEFCGKDFEVNNSRTKYCSRECCREADKKNKREKYAKEYGIGEKHICLRCGKEYKTKSAKSRFCSHSCSNIWSARGRVSGLARFPKDRIINTDITLERLVERDGGICYLCGEAVDINDFTIDEKGCRRVHKNYPSIDHVIPCILGGQHSWDNVRLAHLGCNCSKQGKIIDI